MKYQIYLNKKTSILINKMAEILGKKPSTFIKEFVEGSIQSLETMAGEKAIKEVIDYERK